MITLCKNITEVLTLVNKYHCINDQDCFGQTILHKAIIQGSTDFVIELLKLNANPRIKDKMGRTPIFYASKNRDKMINILLDSEGPVIFTDFDNEHKNFFAFVGLVTGPVIGPITYPSKH